MWGGKAGFLAIFGGTLVSRFLRRSAILLFSRSSEDDVVEPLDLSMDEF